MVERGRRRALSVVANATAVATTDRRYDERVRAPHTQREPSFTPTATAWRAHGRALHEAGEPLDAGTAGIAGTRYGFDFSRVRVHRGTSADLAASAMSARAYTFGEHVVIRQNQYVPRGGVLMHELAHVAEQAGQTPTVMRAPAAAPAPATYLLIYGSGRVNPAEPRDHNARGAFRLAAEAKRREITARLGATAKQNNIVLEYCPTENELKAVLNRQYPLPVKEVHIFSHGWDEGINLGGPDPGGGRRAPDERPQERRVVPEELGDYDIRWADQPSVVLYGCNTGNPVGSPAFAQSASDAFGVPVTGPTTSSHFEPRRPWGLQQVPDRPGTMATYTPTRSAIERNMTQAQALVNRIASRVKVKGGLLTIMKATQEAYALRGRLDRNVTWLQRVLADPRVTVPDRAALRARLKALVKRADALLASR